MNAAKIEISKFRVLNYSSLKFKIHQCSDNGVFQDVARTNDMEKLRQLMVELEAVILMPLKPQSYNQDHQRGGGGTNPTTATASGGGTRHPSGTGGSRADPRLLQGPSGGSYKDPRHDSGSDSGTELGDGGSGSSALESSIAVGTDIPSKVGKMFSATQLSNLR